MFGIQRLMKLHRLYKPAGDGGSDAGGTGTGAGGDGGSQGGSDDNKGQGEGDKGGDGSGAGSDDGKEDKGGDGKPKPSDTEAALLKDLMKQKARAEAAARELATIKERLQAFDGLDAKAARELLEAKAAEEVRQAEAKGEYERVKKQMADQHAAERAAMQASVDAASSKAAALQKEIGDLTIGSAFNTSKFREELTLTPAKARVIYGSHFEFVDGQIVAFDKPAGASERTMLVDSSGNPVGFEAALKKLVDADPDRDELYRSKVRPGAGSATTKRNGPAAVETKALSSVDKIAAGLKKLQQKS